MKVKSLSRVQLLATPWIAAYQAPLPMGFSRQEYWSGVPLSSPFHVLLLSHFSRVRLCVTPEAAAHQVPCPWDSPGKNTGVGCHFLLQCMKVKSESEVAQLCPTLSYPMDCSPPGSSIHGIFQARVLRWGAITFSATYLLAFVIFWLFDASHSNRCKVISLCSFDLHFPDD